MNPSTDSILVSCRDISKQFGGLQALNKVRLEVLKGEVHALVGENGAGKSTLIKILGGVYQRDKGIILFKGDEVFYHEPLEAIHAGIAIIHQELSVIPHMNIIENIFMGRMLSKNGLLLWKEMEKQTVQALKQIGLEIDPYAELSTMSISQKQMVEIARALSIDAQLIIMDEPNSSLSDSETEILFRVIKALTKKGISILYVSHKMDEVMEISDRITVLKDGKYSGTCITDDVTVEDIIRMMVGRELDRHYEEGVVSDESVLDVRNLTGKAFRDVSFKLMRGEILGFSGLVGAGRSEVCRTIFGADPLIEGSIFLKGSPIAFRSPAEAIASGMAMVPEDRKTLSLFLDMPISFNMNIAHFPFLKRRGFINYVEADRVVESYIQKLSIKLRRKTDPVKSLSGGNQQKTVLARWLSTQPEILILDEPTHGVDIGAKAEIYKLIRKLAREGISIILISSELPEIIAMSDRVVVMHEGRVTGILNRDMVNEETLMAYATDVVKNR